MFLCYQARCKVTGKSYIGMTGQTLDQRIKSHARDARRGAPFCFHRAIRKYGLDAFEVEAISTHQTQEDALNAEFEHIRKLGTVAPNGYNMTPGGAGVLSMTDESRKKHREAVTKKHQDPEFKKRHKAGCLKSMTPERLEIISKAHKGKKMHPNAAEAIYKAKQTDAYKKIASKAAKKTWEQDGYKEKWKKATKQKHIANAARFPQRDDGLVFASTRDAANYMKKDGWPKAVPNNICLVCNGKYRHSCGHVWRWIEGETARKDGGIIVCAIA